MHSSSPTTTEQTEEWTQTWTLTWAPLQEPQKREAFLSFDAFTQRLTTPQLHYLSYISSLCEHNTEASQTEAMRLFNAIPQMDQPYLYALMLKPTLLRQMGQVDEAYRYCFTQLCQTSHASMWLEFGGIVWEWMEYSSKESTRTFISTQLRTVTRRHPFAVPRLLLAQLLGKDPAHQDECTELRKEGLQKTHWQPYFKSGIGPWMQLILQQILMLLETLRDSDPETANTYGQHVLHYPWERHLPPHGQTEFESLALLLLQLQLTKEIKRLSERMARKAPQWGRLWFWIGYTSYLHGQSKSSVEYFHRAMECGELERHHQLNMLPILLFEKEFQSSRSLLDAFPDQNTPEYLQMEIEYCNQTNQAQRGLDYCEQLLQHEPEHHSTRLYQAVWLDECERPDEAIDVLQTVLQTAPQETQIYAHLLLIGIYIQHGHIERAEPHIQRLLPQESLFQMLHEDSWRRTFLIHHGMVLEHQNRYDSALMSFEQALRYAPQGPVLGHMLELLWEQERQEEAHQLGQKALQFCPEDRQLRIAVCQMEDFFGNWEIALQQCEELGLDGFSQEEKHNEFIAIKMRCLLGMNQLIEAMKWCEQHIDTIRQDSYLTELRGYVLQEMYTQFERFQKQQGEHETTHQKIIEIQKTLKRERKANQRRERAYKHILHKNESLRHSMSQSSISLMLDSHSQTHDSIPKHILHSLPESQQPILKSALQLWDKLQPHPQDDHGPIVLQLSRVVEGQLNRLWVDPICQWTLQMEYSLSILPQPSTMQLTAKNNRLSLGDATQLLYTQLEKQESDGSFSMLYNPKSTAQHAEIIQTFWCTLAEDRLPLELQQYFQGPFIRELKQLTKIRNHASHANAALTRTQAQSCYTVVLGDSKRKGMLDRLVSWSAFLTSRTQTPSVHST